MIAWLFKGVVQQSYPDADFWSIALLVSDRGAETRREVDEAAQDTCEPKTTLG